MEGDFDRTWDGLPISKEKPHGTAVIVFKRTADGLLYLMLHRGHQGFDYEGEWAWGSPAGARLPEEPVEETVMRELIEETGLVLPCHLTEFGNEDWYVYWAEAPLDAIVILSEEHDRFEWLACEEAAGKCLPDFIGTQLQQVDELLSKND
ncbi:MAG: hypothetical protein JWN30_901 [Bacilli bacterium]|nr:hypothetical protein [Bacilli bacterium]